MDDPIWDPTVFTRNRKRFLAGDIVIIDETMLREAAETLARAQQGKVDRFRRCATS
jgi:hypothetical protein